MNMLFESIHFFWIYYQKKEKKEGFCSKVDVVALEIFLA
jgi:hypothetical protein